MLQKIKIFSLSFFLTLSFSLTPLHKAYSVEPITWFVVGSAVVHGTALALDFFDEPVEADSTPQETSPMQVKLPPLSEDEQEKIKNPDSQPDATHQLDVAYSYNLGSPSTITVDGEIGHICEQMQENANMDGEDGRWTVIEERTMDDVDPFDGGYNCDWVARRDDNREYTFKQYGTATSTDYTCPDGYSMNESSGLCEVDDLPPDDKANIVRDPDTNKFIQDPRDTDPMPSGFNVGSDGTVQATRPLPEGGSVTSSATPLTEGGTEVKNEQYDVPVTKSDGSETTADITDTTVVDSNGDIVSQDHTIVYADGTTPSDSDYISGGNNTSGDVSIDESGTPDSAGYGNADYDNIDSELDDYSTPVDPPTPDLDFAPVWGVGASCDPQMFNVSVAGETSNLDICPAIDGIQSALYYLFALLTAIFLLHTWTTLNKGR